MFTSSGLDPYYGLHAVTRGRDYGTPTEGTFSIDGEEWTAELSPRSSNLAPYDDPSFQFDTVKEFNLKVRPTDSDATDERKATYHIAPRWPNMESLGDGSNPSNPLNAEGIAAKVHGSNLPIDTYPVLLRQGMDSVTINPAYFTEIHPYSNISAYERYVRINRGKSGRVVGSGGTFERIWEQVGTGDGSYREFTEDNREIEGYYNTVTFDTGGASALLSSHTLGKQLKHYHPKHVRSEGSDDPLAHPKVGVCFKKGRTDSGAVKWSDRDALESELDETLLNVLSWSGLSIRADYRTYVADSHFEGIESNRPLSIIDDPLPEIRREQEGSAHEVLIESGGSDRQVLRAMTDGGGPQSIASLADQADVSTRTVYRIINRLSEVIENRAGSVRFRSGYLRDRISDQIRSLGASIKEAADRSDSSSAWGRILARYGIEVDDREDARLTFRLGDIPASRSIEDVMKDLYHAWPGSRSRFRNAHFKYRKDGYNQVLRTYDPLG